MAGGMLSTQVMRDVVPLFLHNGLPVEFYLDENLGETLCSRLRGEITKAGGTLARKYSDSRVIVSNDTMPSFEVLKERFKHDNNVFVEPPSWVSKCFSTAKYKHTELAPKIVGGRRPGAA